KEAQKNPNSPKALLLQDELRKVRKRRDQIFTYRERKLALLASSRASGAEVEVPNLPAQERGLFESMVALLTKSRADAFGGSLLVAEVESPSPPTVAPKSESAKKEPERMKVVRAEDTKRVAVPPSLKDHVLPACTIELPVLVLNALVMEGNAPIWPYEPILSGSWVIVVLILRAAVRSKILFSERAHVREIARQEISRLESRIDEVQRKSG